ncbi:DUF4384 domain-containing protein [Archangium violaceum]|uniref:DUF4384 domain-containing protein n=1 Tax=Archangium violaceum TaxID=83451 RepID=UPI00194FA1DB|nr:DUF4384 domain-containing protein [Archangium violaceum]QRN97211.1 DUF4384 domain-containing protein [Archangium violaceum]
MSQGGRRIQDAVLEMYLASALEPEARARVDEELASSEADRERLAELRADSAAFLLRQPPAAFAARLEPEPRKERRRWRVLLGAALAMSAAAVFGGVMLRPVVEAPGPEYAAKGSLVLGVYRNQAGGGVPVGPGETLGEGESIQFDVKADASGYVAVLSRDGAGRVTVYYPYGGDAAVAYVPGRSLLPGAIELDGTPGTEALYALFSPEPFTLGAAVKALESGAPLEPALPQSVRVARTQLTKRP